MRIMEIQLSEGAIQTIMTGGSVDEPVLQILGSKRLMNNGTERYRLLISDGRHINSFAMIATQLNDIVSSGQVPDHSIIKVLRHITSVINNNAGGEKRVMVILELEVLKNGKDVGLRIGNPVAYDAASVGASASNGATTSNGASTSNGATTRNGASTSNGTSAAVPTQQTQPSGRVPAQRQVSNYGNSVRMASPAPGPSTPINPISSLNPYQNRWCIKARVSNKPPIRTYTNARGEGKLFSVVFTDESGEIKCTGFNNAVTKFYDLLEVGKAYLVSNCTLKVANKQFSNAEYEMTFHDDSQIVPCADDDLKLPNTIYNFVPIQKMSELPNQQQVDVIGVAVQVGDVQTFTARNSGKELKKRDVGIVDQTNQMVTLTLWDTNATDFDGQPGAVIAAKGVSINEFMGGKSVSARFSSTIQINPDIPEAHRLRGWYDNGGATSEVQSISAKTGGQGASGNWMMLGETAANGLGMGDKADYFTSAVKILMARSENCFYRACPADGCKKKVMDMNNSKFRCEKCNREFDNFLYRLLLSLQVSDGTGSHWVTLFHEEAEKLLQCSGQIIGEKIDNNDESYKEPFTSLLFTTHQMKFRCKLETYNDESRLKFNVVAVDRFDPKSYARRLLTNFKNDEGIRRGL